MQRKVSCKAIRTRESVRNIPDKGVVSPLVARWYAKGGQEFSTPEVLSRSFIGQ